MIWPYTVAYCTVPGHTVPYRHAFQFVPYRIVRKDCVLDAPVSYRQQYQYDVSIRIMRKRQSTVHYRTLPYRVLGGGTWRACSLGICTGTISVSAAQNFPSSGNKKSSCIQGVNRIIAELLPFLCWPTLGRLQIHVAS